MRIDYKTWGLIILALLIGSLVVLKDPWHQWPTREGLDIAGGVRVVMELQPTPGVPINTETQRQVIQVLEKRVNSLGVSEPVIQPKNDNQVIVELAEKPGANKQPLDKNAAIQTLVKTAKLEFIYLKEVKSEKNPFGRYDFNGSSNTFTDRQTNKTLTDKEAQEQILYKDPANIIITGRNLKPGAAAANFGPNGAGSMVTLELDPQGTDKFRDFTAAHVKDLMAIVYDGKVQSAPVINEEIPNGNVQITLGNAPLAEAVQMKDLLNSGALPVPLAPIQIQEVEASLGHDSVMATYKAGIIGLIAVCVFMAVYYLLPGLVADVALIFYALLTFAVFKLLGVVLTLPGIAGFILSIGMAVDANILIFERTKEELRAGRTLHSAIDAGFKRAFPSIRDSNLSTLITCAILWMFGTGPIRGFALVLAIGVILSFFTAVTVTRTLLHLIVNDNVAAHPSWFGVTRSWMNRQGKRGVDVVRNRWLYFGISLGLIIPGLLFLAMGGLKPGIDFTGGAAIQYHFEKQVVSADIHQTVQSAGLKDVMVQLSAGTAGGQDALVRTRGTGRDLGLSPAQRASIINALKAKYPGVRESSYSTVGPSISKELVKNAFLAVIYACIALTFFLAYQFRTAGIRTGLKYGVCAVIALFHDVLVLLGIFAIMGYLRNWEVDSLFVTAMLTVIGFSVHDTIIIFDRIRENWRNREKGADFGTVMNASVNQTLSRSINTSLTVIITLLALFFFGGSVLKLFIAALLFGIISGTYSSIFNASPLLWLWDRRGTGERERLAVPAAAPAAPQRRTTPTSTPSSPRVTPTTRRVTPLSTPAAPTTDEDGEEAEETAGANGRPRPTARPAAGAGARPQQVRAKRKKRF